MRVCVVGDLLLDRDLEGRVERLCPDAPAPVVDEIDRVDRAGGAGLAALLVAGCGARTTLVTAVAPDSAGARLRALLVEGGVSLVDCGEGGSTPEKVRVRADGRSLVRLDRGDGARVGALPESGRREIEAADAILVSDYGRGVVASPAVRTAVVRAVAAGVPLVWDPHPKGARPVHGAMVVTPNAVEAEILSGVTADRRSPLGVAADQAAHLLREWRARHVAITLGAAGALLVSGPGAPLVLPVDRPVTGGDPCGAGDAFAAAVTSTLARGALVSEAVARAVDFAAGFVAAGGAAALGRRSATPREGARDAVAEVRSVGGTVVATGGCFDVLHPGHVSTLERARRLGDCLVVLLNSDGSVRRLKGHDRPLQPAEDRAAVLRSLACVDEVVVFDGDTPTDALRDLRPDIWVKGGDYSAADLPETPVVRGWGGTVVTMPFVHGRSTSEILARGRRSAAGALETPRRPPMPQEDAHAT